MTGPAVAPRGHFLLAPHHLRLFAFLLDYLLIIAGLKLAEQIFLGEGWDLRLATEAPRVFPPWWIAAIAALFLFKDLLGASAGKWMMGISVRLREHPERVAPSWRTVGRNLPIVVLPVAWLAVGIAAAPLLDRLSHWFDPASPHLEAVIAFAVVAVVGVLVESLQVFRDAQLRRFGDRWFGTVVVVREPEVPVVRRAFGLGSLFLGFVLAALLITSWNLRRTSAYQVAQHAVTTQAAIVSRLGEPVEWDRSPTMDLRLDQGMALLIFKAKGQQRASEVRVRLVLIRSQPPVWNVGSIDMPNPQAETPLVRPAPAKP